MKRRPYRRVRECPHCGGSYDSTRPLLRADGVTTAYVYGEYVCIPEDAPPLEDLRVADNGRVYYEVTDE